jgi:hypothetical protein
MDGDHQDANAKPQEEGGWQYKSENATDVFAPAPDTGAALASSADSAGVAWSASEFVAHEKSFSWYAILLLLAVLIGAVLYVATRDLLSMVVVLIMAIILAVIGARKPRVIAYKVDGSGLTAGNKFYPYRVYKSFAVPDEGPFASVVLIPLKRFELPVSAYLAPDSQQKVLEILSSHLPMAHGELDAMERLMRQLRF